VKCHKFQAIHFYLFCIFSQFLFATTVMQRVGAQLPAVPHCSYDASYFGYIHFVFHNIKHIQRERERESEIETERGTERGEKKCQFMQQAEMAATAAHLLL